jgi:hypothetical protein
MLELRNKIMNRVYNSSKRYLLNSKITFKRKKTMNFEKKKKLKNNEIIDDFNKPVYNNLIPNSKKQTKFNFCKYENIEKNNNFEFSDQNLQNRNLPKFQKVPVNNFPKFQNNFNQNQHNDLFCKPKQFRNLFQNNLDTSYSNHNISFKPLQNYPLLDFNCFHHHSHMNYRQNFLPNQFHINKFYYIQNHNEIKKSFYNNVNLLKKENNYSLETNNCYLYIQRDNKDICMESRKQTEP